MERIYLDGIWQRRIGEGPWAKQTVPYSCLCVGQSECMLQFDAEKKNGRVFLVFEGITYGAEVVLNGVCLGKMLPYSVYRYDVTEQLRETGNVLCVLLQDMNLPFGPSAGWENFGGIIRSVYLDYTGSAALEDVIWHSELKGDYSEALCFAEPVISGEAEDRVRLLDDAGVCVAEASCRKVETAKFTLREPKLWSTDTPCLYTLESEILQDGVLQDSRREKVGFKDFCIRGRRFWLNGKPCYLHGVTRHDTWGDEGHTLSEEKLRRDMQMIKDVGCNFVRLVHYPHNRKVVEIADEIGLLVSEEPGLWWSDMHNPDTCSGALEVLRRTICRDRNRVSVAFWLSFNECQFTLEFLKDSVRVAREADPYHLVSGANCMSLEMTKPNYLECGFDFYTMHPYTRDPQRFRDCAEYLTEMPLVFTEWGGCDCDNNPRLFAELIDCIKALKNGPEETCLAGAMFWTWAEIRECNRGLPACRDGILNEGLVDRFRTPTVNYKVFTEGFRYLNAEEPEKEYDIWVNDEACASGEYFCLEMPEEIPEDPSWARMVKRATQPMDKFAHARRRMLDRGPVPPKKVDRIGGIPVKLCGKPFVLGEAPLAVPVEKQVSELIVIGNVSMPKGWPIDGQYGDPAAVYTVEYTDGTKEEHIMRNGQEITTATRLYGSSRIDPLACRSPRAMEFGYDRNWELYVVNLHKIPVDREKTVKCITFRAADPTYDILLYGVTGKE